MHIKHYLLAALAVALGAVGSWAKPPAIYQQIEPQPIVKTDASLSKTAYDKAAMQERAEAESKVVEQIAEKRLGQQSADMTAEAIDTRKTPGFELTDRKFRPGKISAPSKAPLLKAGREMKTGVFFSREYNALAEKSNAYQLEVARINDDGLFSVSNVRGLKGTIEINVDEETGLVRIQPQKIYTHSTYGELWMCPIDLQQGIYSTQEEISGMIGTDGVIKLGNWGLFAVSGSYQGANFGIFTETKWMPTNATIKITAPAGKENQEFVSVVEQINDNEVNIFNIIGNANYVALRLYPDKSVQMSPQWVFTNPLYGDVSVYYADFANNKINYSKPVEGSATDSSITLGGWCAALRSGQGIALQAVSTSIDFSGLKLRFPAAAEFKLSGEGTASSPWLIKTPADMNALSQAVAGGQTFAGKHFALDADIDLSAIKYTYVAIGDETHPFAGHFDGKNHKLHGLKCDGRGFPEVGYFGFLGAKGVIENLNVKNTTFRGSGANIGVIAAVAYGTIRNCNVSARLVTTSETTGGIAGQLNGSIENCTFSGSIDGTGTIGGIAGICFGSIAKSSTLATIEMTGQNSSLYCQAAGIAGQLLTPKGSKASKISDCHVSGSIADSYGFNIVGGIVGLSAQGEIVRSFNTAAITSLRRDSERDNYAGGVAAWSSGSIITDCFNAGSISRSLGTGVSGSEMVGGIVGYLSVSYTLSQTGTTINNVSTITNCFNTGQISAPSEAGHKGIYGDTYTSYGFEPIAMTFKNCFFDNQINGFDDERYGRPTSFFTAALPEGFSPEIWSATPGRYPLLIPTRESEAAKLASAAFLLTDGETVRKVKKNILLSGPDEVKWQLFEGDKFVNETESMKIDANQLSVKNQYGTNILVATTKSGNLKLARLAAVPKAFDGEGTKESPYLIKSVADMQRLNEAVATYAQPHEGDFFRLTADLNFAGSNFHGIGNSVRPFGGDFDGMNHTVSHLSIDNTNSKEWYAGLFHTALKGSAIRNIHIASDAALRFYHYSGAVVGYTEGIVDNCSNASSIIQTGSYGAGIVGMAGEFASISNCYNSGKVVSTGNGAAGIVGMNIGSVSLCQNDGEIIGGGTGEAGGIVSAHAGTIDRCVNNATVKSLLNVGGIAGNITSAYGKGDITNCIDNGIVVITGTGTYLGAIGGYLAGTPKFENNLFDISININGSIAGFGRAGNIGISTRELVAGKALDGFSTDEFSFEAGKYPVLKQFAAKPAAQTLRSMYVKFAEGESRANLTLDAELAKPDGIKWELTNKTNFAIAGEKLSVTVPEGMKVANDTLRASLGDDFVKIYPIRTMPDVLEGKGSLEKPYLIKNFEDLDHLALFIDSTAMEFSGYMFKLVNDIDCSGKEFHPIGKMYKFNGIFDGNGKRIHGIDYFNDDYKTGRGIGFFGTIGEASTIKQLTLEGKIVGHSYVGGFAGKLYGTIENCVNRMLPDASKSSGSYAGGFAAQALNGARIVDCVNEANIAASLGYAGGFVAAGASGMTIENCINKGNISAKGPSAGGFAASSGGSFINCINEGSVSATMFAGGIVARNTGTLQSTYKGCRNSGTITTQNGSMGGIIGSVPLNACVVITDCHNTADLTATSTVGGIAGELRQGTTITLCSNSGNITATASSGSYKGYVGGITGNFGGAENWPSLMEKCYNTGRITGHEQYTAGIAGKATSSTIRDCYNLGDVSSTKGLESGSNKVWETGGICGNNTGTIERCWNAGNIYSNGYACGGISGLAQSDLNGCFNLGKVTVETGNDHPDWGGIAGGITAYVASSGTITNCYNLGEISVPDYAAGVVGGISSTWSIANCYNAGRVIATNPGASHIYEIAGPTSGSIANVKASELFFLSGINPEISGKTGLDSRATACSEKELRSAPLGQAFLLERASLPTIVGTYEPALANHAAAGIDFMDNDTKEAVTKQVYLSQLEGLNWEGDSKIVILADKAYPQELGNAVLTVSTADGSRSKQFTINVTEVAGMEAIDAEAEAIEKSFFTPSGLRVAEPQAPDGKIYVVIAKYSDGSIRTFKLINN